MKAFLLAAGLGTRLKPLTNDKPKCLIPIAGQPLLAWWLDLLLRHGVDEVLINTHHLPEQVTAFVQPWTARLRITLAHEPALLGSAGTLRAHADFVHGEHAFFVLYADNLTDYNLSDFWTFHRRHGGLLSMALFRTNIPQQCGIAELNSDDQVVAFEEKPLRPRSNLANAGLYVASPAVLPLIPDLPVADIGFHLLPQLVGRMYGWHPDAFLMDIGTLENLHRAEALWQGKIGAI